MSGCNQNRHSVAVIILTWNHRERTAKCLESISNLNYPTECLRVIVVDNGSTDDTIEFVRREYPDAELIINHENLGYAAGNNVGVAQAMKEAFDFVFIVNNDVLVAPDALTNLMQAADENPTAGFLGPKIYQSDAPQTLQSAGTAIDRWGRSHQIGLNQLDQGQFDEQREVDSIVGCAALIRSTVVDRVGLLDERFRLYLEDLDWCLRARVAGFKVLYVPRAEVWHRSSNARDTETARMMYYLTRNTYLLLSKHRFGVVALGLAFVQHLTWLLNWTFNPKWKHKREQRDSIARALIDALQGDYG